MIKVVAAPSGLTVGGYPALLLQAYTTQMNTEDVQVEALIIWKDSRCRWVRLTGDDAQKVAME